MRCESENDGKVVGSFLHAALSLVFDLNTIGWGLVVGVCGPSPELILCLWGY